jgi:hypothetical protein
MKHQSGNGHLLCEIDGIDVSVHLPKTQCILRACSDALKFIETRRDLGSCVGYEVGREKVAKHRIGRSPSITNHRPQNLEQLSLFGVGSLEPTAKIAAQENKASYSLWILDGIVEKAQPWRS